MTRGRTRAIKRLQRLAPLAVCAPALLAALPAGAETVDAERIEERLPAQSPAGRADPAAASEAPLKVDEADLASIPEFVLKGAVLKGMTAVAQSDADACIAPQLGQTVGAADLMGLTGCITKLYRDRGYFLSRAYLPPQEVQNGMLAVTVVEGYIGAVEAEGLSAADAETQFAATLGERPARLATFERDLLLLADRHGFRVESSQLLADPAQEGRYTFKLKVAVAGLSWRLYGDNRGSGRDGSDQAFAWAAWNSLAAPGDRLAASLFTSPTDIDGLLFGDFNYALPFLGGELWSEAGASFSRSEHEDGSDSAVERVYARLSTPLVRSRAQSLWVSLAFDARESADHMAGVELVDERLRVLRGTLSYSIVEGATRTDLAIETSHGLDAFDASRNGAPRLTNVDARPQFTKVRLDAALTHRFAAGWDASIQLSGQLADGGLSSVEEFGAGGARFGRAYDYSEITGDDGIAGSIELRHTWTDVADWMKSVQVYAFADAAMIWNRQSDPAAAPEADLSSAGLGLRLTPVPGVIATFELAQPLTRDVADTGDRGLRAFVSLLMGW